MDLWRDLHVLVRSHRYLPLLTIEVLRCPLRLVNLFWQLLEFLYLFEIDCLLVPFFFFLLFFLAALSCLFLARNCGRSCSSLSIWLYFIAWFRALLATGRRCFNFSLSTAFAASPPDQHTLILFPLVLSSAPTSSFADYCFSPVSFTVIEVNQRSSLSSVKHICSQPPVHYKTIVGLIQISNSSLLILALVAIEIPVFQYPFTHIGCTTMFVSITSIRQSIGTAGLLLGAANPAFCVLEFYVFIHFLPHYVAWTTAGGMKHEWWRCQTTKKEN